MEQTFIHRRIAFLLHDKRNDVCLSDNKQINEVSVECAAQPHIVSHIGITTFPTRAHSHIDYEFFGMQYYRRSEYASQYSACLLCSLKK